jgi:Family of unknown function (DUF6152)
MRYRQVSLALAALLAGNAAAVAHHSFAMFDQANQIVLEGVVQQFNFVSPHTFILLDVKKDDGTESWLLEGGSPSALARDGWSRTSLKPGDQVWVRIAPLRSGAPGGAWVPEKIKFRDGRPVVEPPPDQDRRAAAGRD